MADNDIIRGGLGLVTDKTKKKKKNPNPQQEPLAYGARLKITKGQKLLNLLLGILKSLIASQLVYILSPLPTKHAALDEINNMLYDFLWSGRGDKIKRDVMISDYKHRHAKRARVIFL